MDNSIRMQLDSNDEWPSTEPVGSFDINLGGVQGYPQSNAHILFVCPNKQRCGVLLGTKNVDRPNPKGLCIWGWDGNIKEPTIKPSINCISTKDGKPTGGCGWHGFITKGVMSTV